MRMDSRGRCSYVMLLAVIVSGCSTVTPYSLDIAKELTAAGKMTEEEAVSIIDTRAKISSEYADYKGFAMDEKGFSTVKTSQSSKTEWRDGKAVKVNVTNTNTRNVPWTAIRHITPYLRQYKYLFGDAYQVTVQYVSTGVSHGARAERIRSVEFGCKTYEDLVEVVAALRVLSGT